MTNTGNEKYQHFSQNFEKKTESLRRFYKVAFHGKQSPSLAAIRQDLFSLLVVLVFSLPETVSASPEFFSSFSSCSSHIHLFLIVSSSSVSLQNWRSSLLLYYDSKLVSLSESLEFIPCVFP